MIRSKRILGVLLAMLMSIIALLPFASSAVSALTTTSGTIIMSNSTSSALLTTQHGGTTNVNGKYIRNSNNEFIPVYCIEHGTSLNTGDSVTRSDLTPDNGTIVQQSGASKRLTQEEINRIGLIYVCGYNGYNGWGTPDEGIASNSATPSSNPNFAKYVATQILVWEVTEGYEMGSNNAEVQRCVDIIRSRMSIYDAFMGDTLTGENANDGNSIVETGQLVPHPNISAAIANALPVTSEERNGTYHFRYSYPGWLNPAGSTISCSDGASVINYSSSDFTTTSHDATFVLRNRAEYSEHLSDSDVRMTVYAPSNVYLWTPTNGNQLTISADAIPRDGYLAFRTPEQVEEYMTLDSTLRFEKKDYKGNSARGAKFEVYSGYSSGRVSNRIGVMNDSNGIYTFSLDSGVLGTYGTLSSDVVTKKFYITETEPAKEVLINGRWQPCDFILDSTVYEVSYVINPANKVVNWYLKKADGSSVINQGSTNLIAGRKISIPVGWGDYQVINIMNTYAQVGITLNKIDDSNNAARGAQFTIYDDVDGNVLGVMIDTNNDGHYAWIDNGQLLGSALQNDNSTHTAQVYIKETSPATEIYINGQWCERNLISDDIMYKVEFSWNPSTGEIVAKVYNVVDGILINTVSGGSDGSVDKVIVDAHIGDVTNYLLGSMRINKVDIDSLQPLSGAKFEVYDSDDEFFAMLDSDENGEYILRDIPVGVYTVREVAAPEYHEIDPHVYEFEITAEAPDVVIDNSSYMSHDGMFVNGPSIVTHARSASDSYLTQTGEGAVVIDTITYTGLIPGVEYEVRGELVDKTTDDVLSTGCSAFVPEDMTGSVEVVFDIENADVGNAVVYEYIYRIDSNKCVGMHKDHDDPNQSVSSVRIHTTLLDENYSESVRHTSFGRTVNLVDKVAYSGLIPGLEYELRGSLVVKETGERLENTGRVLFVPNESEGEVEVTFTGIDTTLLSNLSLVAFERLYLGGDLIAIHEDINDVNQLLNIPNIGTELTDKNTGTHMASYSAETVLVDTIRYYGLTAGKTYTVSGILMDKDTGEAILDDSGKEVTASGSFVAGSIGSGLVQVEFIVNSRILTGKTVVAFEDVYHEGIRVACHADINDVPQSVEFPELITSASVGDEKVFDITEEVDIVDRVNYTGLETGRTYILRGALMNPSGTGYRVDNNQVISEIEFVPQNRSGSVDIHFVVPGSELVSGQSVVVYEHVYDKVTGVEVAMHADLQCKEQTVTVKSINPPSPPPSTGETPMSVTMVIGSVISSIGAFIILQKVVVLSNRRKEK